VLAKSPERSTPVADKERLMDSMNPDITEYDSNMQNKRKIDRRLFDRRMLDRTMHDRRKCDRRKLEVVHESSLPCAKDKITIQSIFELHMEETITDEQVQQILGRVMERLREDTASSTQGAGNELYDATTDT